MKPMHRRRKWRSRAAKARHTYHARFTKVKHWRKLEAETDGFVSDVYNRLIAMFMAAHREQFGVEEPVLREFNSQPISNASWNNMQIMGKR